MGNILDKCHVLAYQHNPLTILLYSLSMKKIIKVKSVSSKQLALLEKAGYLVVIV